MTPHKNVEIQAAVLVMREQLKKLEDARDDAAYEVMRSDLKMIANGYLLAITDLVEILDL